MILPILQVSITVLLMATGIIFAFAEGSPLAALTVPIALGTLFLVDWKGLRLPASAATALGVIALIAVIAELIFGDVHMSRVLSGGHLLVYLTWVLLLLPKDQTQYWRLCALSILQIALASVLTNAFWLGGALIGYTFIASWVLAVMLVYRSIESAQRGDSDLKLQPADSDIQDRSVVGKTWGSVSRDLHQSLINPRFVGSTLVVTCLGMGLSALFFLFTPRVWMQSFTFYDSSPMSATPLTGFTEQVRLGDLGEILENDSRVMTITMLHLPRAREFQRNEYKAFLETEPLFRGAVLESYERGQWGRISQETTQVPRARDVEPTTRIRVNLSPIGTNTVFGYGNMLSTYGSSPSERLRQGRFSEELLRPRDSIPDRDCYYTLEINKAPPDMAAAAQREWRMSAPILPQFEEFRSDMELPYAQGFAIYLAQLKTVPPGMDRLRQRVDEMVAGETDKAKAVEQVTAWLRDSKDFRYSLKLNVMDSSVDPIEDFVFNRKAGHCEYFASSLAIMLRMIDVPTRLISGFKGGTLSPNGRSINVQQLHAHTWVEAYLDGHWLTLDPTPEVRNESVKTVKAKAAATRSLWNDMLGAWNYGMHLTRDNQQQMLYYPLQRMARQQWSTAQELYAKYKPEPGQLRLFLRSPRKWFSVQGGVFAFVLLTALSGIVWVLRKLGVRFISGRGSDEDRRARRIAFFERFNAMLRKEGLLRQPTQTPREFVSKSLATLEPRLSAQGMVSWPSEVVEKFYQVRFGNDELGDEALRDLDRRLTEMERCLATERTVKS